jgi:hypothetical protein
MGRERVCGMQKVYVHMYTIDEERGGEIILDKREKFMN